MEPVALAGTHTWLFSDPGISRRSSSLQFCPQGEGRGSCLGRHNPYVARRIYPSCVWLYLDK